MACEWSVVIVAVSRHLGWGDGPWTREQLRDLLLTCLKAKSWIDETASSPQG